LCALLSKKIKKARRHAGDHQSRKGTSLRRDLPRKGT
jgi:hypothetical protein